LIGFDRPAIANARNETRMPGDHCTRVRVMLRIGWSKWISEPNCILSFIIFLSVINHRRRAAFYKQPPAVVGPFRVSNLVK
jgi:hypothetical protein